jgi:SNF2 family DNA or RNA helicase
MLTLPLHPYQEPAVDRFLERHSLLVAYDMGLGKTPIAIAGAEELLGDKTIGLVLLVVPASLRYQWAQALAKFTDLPTRELKVKAETITVPTQETCAIVDGGPANRRTQLAQARTADYVIVSYNTVLTDIRAVRRLHAGMVVLDEATAIKTFGAERTLKIKRSLTAPYRLALTGTPVENRPDEAFSIMEWVDPSVLGAFDLFDKTYVKRDGRGNVKGHKNLRLFNHRLQEAMVRRSRTEPGVREYLPEVDHRQWYVDMDKPVAAAYAAMAADLLDELLKIRGGADFDLGAYYRGEQGENTPLGRVMARQQAIQMLLDHPTLVESSALLWEDTLHQGGSRYCHAVQGSGLLDGLGHSVKLDLLRSKVTDILGFEGTKILVFSQHPEMLQIIEDELAGWYTQCVQYHGRMSTAAKAAAVTRFATDPGCRLFLSSHAGAYGTDMKMASHLINYDLPWSSGRADQINGRHQRAGSEFSKVFIADLIVNGTIEERKFDMLDYKRRVAAAVVDGVVPRSGRIENDLVSLTQFLLDN